MNCPVCQHENIPSLASNCPDCDTNLLSLKILESLEEHYIGLYKNKVQLAGEIVSQKKDYQKLLRKKVKTNSWLLFLLFCISILFFFYKSKAGKEIDSPIVVQHDSLEYFKNKIQEAEMTKNMVERQLMALEGTRSVQEIMYVVKKGDVLFDLGKLFYNDSLSWVQIAADNNIEDERKLPTGDTLVIKYRK